MNKISVHTPTGQAKMLSTNELKKAILDSSDLIFTVAEPFFDSYDYPLRPEENEVKERWNVECDPWLELYSELVMLEEARETLKEDSTDSKGKCETENRRINRVVADTVDQLLQDTFKLSTVYCLLPLEVTMMVDRYYLLLWVLAQSKTPHLETDRLFIYAGRLDLLSSTKRLTTVHLTAISSLSTATDMVKSFDLSKFDQMALDKLFESLKQIEEQIALYYLKIAMKKSFFVERSITSLLFHSDGADSSPESTKSVYRYIETLLDEKMITPSLSLIVSVMNDADLFTRLIDDGLELYTVDDAIGLLLYRTYQYSERLCDHIDRLLEGAVDYQTSWVEVMLSSRRVIQSWILPCIIHYKPNLIDDTNISWINPDVLATIYRQQPGYLANVSEEKMRSRITDLITSYYELHADFKPLVDKYGVDLNRICSDRITIVAFSFIVSNARLLLNYREEIGMALLVATKFSSAVIKNGLFSLNAQLLLKTIQSSNTPVEAKKELLNQPSVKEALGKKEWRQLMNLY